MQLYVEKAIDNIPVIDTGKRYWFIRTYAGEAFDIYKDGNFVGLGLNNVPTELIKNVKNKDIELTTYRQLHSYIEKNTIYTGGSATRWANQLIDFYHNVSIGDTVVIPSENSTKLAIGTITSNVYIVKDPPYIFHRDERVQLPEKRRKVTWQKEVYKDNLQGDLKGMLSSQSGISNADEYGEIIEGYIDSLFIKESQIYLILKIDQDEEINAFAFNDLLSSITYFYKEFAIENNDETAQDLTIKIRVQSKGKVALKALSIAGLIGLAGLIALSSDAEFSIDISKGKAEGKSGKGVLKSYSDFLDAKQERRIRWELFKDSLEAVKAKRENANELKDTIPDKPKQ